MYGHTHNFFFFFAPRKARGNPYITPIHTYVSSFRVPVRTRYGSSAFVGPVCDRHQSAVYLEDVGI